MRFATYNVWNDSESIGSRLEQLIQEITQINADVIALQEVTSDILNFFLQSLPDYKFYEYRNYTGEDEGLAVFSKYPIDSCSFLHTEEKYANSNALNVLFQVGKQRFSLMNVHLPWDSIKVKEEQIIAINKLIKESKECADYFLLLGDFNCDTSSSVHRFLVGGQTLYGNETNPCWLDIAGNYAELHNITFPPTLDCINNPRWKGKNSIYASENFDKIYILDNWNYFSFENVQVFGTEVNPLNNLCASDHYGVMAEINFVK